tara:strand:- start:1649 stop:2830 length:1182 start_codon:yes stop_codon:yes gene_type:complete
MPQVVILTSYPFPGFAATSNRVLSLAKGIAVDKYFKVTVIGPGPDRNMEGQRLDNELFNVLSINKKQYAGSNLFIRALNEAKLFIHLSYRTIKCHPDLIVVTIPSIFLLGVTILKKKNIPIIIDVRDLVWEYFLKKTLLYRIVGKFMKKICTILLRQADKVTLTNQAEFNSLIEYVSSPKIIYNGLDKSRYNQLKSLLNYRSNKQSQGISITYAGNIGLAQRLDTLINAARNLQNIKVTLIGNGKDFLRLNNYINDNHIKNVVMTGELDWLTILKYYKKTDIFFVQIGKEFTTALPSKIFEYLATGKGLILAAPPGPATDLASTFDGIYTIEPENSAILRKKILSLVTTRDVTYIKNVRIIAEKYLREDQAALFSKIVKDTYYNKFKNNLILD